MSPEILQTLKTELGLKGLPALQQTKQNRTLCAEGFISPCIYVLLRGSATGHVKNGSTKAICIHYSTGDILGAENAFSEGLSPHNITITAGSEYIEIPLSFIKGCKAALRGQILFEANKSLVSQSRRLSRALQYNIGTKTVARKIIEFFTHITQEEASITLPTGDGWVINLSIKDIASSIGCSRERTGREIKRLIEDGKIGYNGTRPTFYKGY